MSNPPFNPNDFNQNGTTQDILNTVAENYLRNNGLTNSTATTNFLSTVNLSSDTNLSGNIIASTKTISPLELSQLDGINTNQTIQQQINGIGGGTALLSSNNIWGGTNQFNNNIIVNGSTITPTELSYIDNTTSNIQNQLNTNSTNISNVNTILSNNQITSSTNIIDSINYLQSQITNLPNGSSSGQSYFLTDTTSTVNNQYKTISNIPANSTNQVLTSGVITSSSGNVLMGQFITDNQLNITSIPAGIWDFNFYANLTNNNLSSYLIVEVYKYNGSATLLFTMNGDDINSANIIPYNINSTQTAYTVLTTDYLMIRIYGKTTSTQNITINIDYNSSNYYSHFHLPSIQRQNHNDLLNIQGGQTNEYYHLNQSQYNNIINPASISQNGYLTSTAFNTFNNKANTTLANGSTDGLLSNTDWTLFNSKAPSTIASSSTNGLLSLSDWTIFNNKQNNIVATTSSDYYRGDKTFQPLNKAAIGLSNVVNTNFTQLSNGIIYVNGLNGSDSVGDGLSLLTAYKTISGALNNGFINSGYQVVIYPGTYNENISISQNNLSIVGTNNEIGGIININGNITISSNSTSVRLCSLTFNALTLSGSANLYLKDNNINGNFTKSGNGYLSISNCIFGITSIIQITGSGNCNIMNGCQLGSNFTVGNSGAIVVIMNNQYITNVNITAGIISIFQTVIYGKSTAPAFNCCNVSGGSAIYLNNCDLIDSVTNQPYIINVSTNSFYSLRNCTINYSGSTLSGTNLGRISYFDNISSGGGVLVDTTSAQTLTNKTLTDPKLTNNIIKSSTNNNITFVNSADTIVNLNSAQTMTNKTLTNPILSNNIIKSSTNNNITFVDVADTIVNLNSAQTISNKNMTNLILGDDYFKTSLNRVVNVPNSNDTLVNLNSVQTMTNKLLTDCAANTQLTTDNTTKLATTAYVKNLLATSNSYVNTAQATSPSFTLTTTYQDIASITIPVAGTYELNMDVMGSADTEKSVFIILYNSTTSSEVANSFMTINSINVNVRITANASKLLIVENVAANTVFKLQAKCTSGGTNYIYNNATYGYTYLSYKMLGLTTNVPLNTKWSDVKTTAPYTFNFGTNGQFNMVFQSSSGTTSSDLYLFVDNSSSSSFNISVLSMLCYSASTGGSTYQIASNQTITKTSGYTQLSAAGITTNPGRGVKGDIFDLTNKINYRFTVFYINSSNCMFLVEQINIV
jgi:hypothetical protein